MDRPRNGDISLFQRFLEMGASTADCISQIAESIPKDVEASGIDEERQSDVYYDLERLEVRLCRASCRPFMPAFRTVL
jgi:hypothetical protein